MAVFHGNGIAQLDPRKLIHASGGLAAELVPVFLQQRRVQLGEAKVTEHPGSLLNAAPAELVPEDLHPVLPLQAHGRGQPVLFQQEVLPPDFPGSMIQPGLNHRIQGVGRVQPLRTANRETLGGQAVQRSAASLRQPFRQSAGKGCADTELFQALQLLQGPGSGPPRQEVPQLRGKAGLFVDCPVSRAAAVPHQLGRQRVQTGNPASAEAKGRLTVPGGKAGIGVFQELFRLLPLQRQGAGTHRSRQAGQFLQLLQKGNRPLRCQDNVKLLSAGKQQILQEKAQGLFPVQALRVGDEKEPVRFRKALRQRRRI